MALPPPFGTDAGDAVSPLPSLQSHLDPLQRDARFANMSVALVDLTGPVNVIGGWNLTKPRYSASLVKISAMFAAFRLRENLTAAAGAAGAKDPKDMVAKVTADWKPIVEKSVAGGVKDFPQLEKIFKITGSGSSGWTIEFTPTYLKSLQDMIGPSDNHAASHCILSLGYQYINGALAAEGFYKAGEGGLWLGGDYTKKGRDGLPEPISHSFQAASAAAVVKLMVLVEKDHLVSPTASGEMRGLMNNNYMARILRADSRPATREFGKLGIGSGDGSFHDAAVVERSVNGHNIIYVSVMLGSHGFNPNMPELGRRLDDIIVGLHP